MSEIQTGSIVVHEGGKYLIIDHEVGIEEPNPGDQILNMGSVVFAYDLVIIDVRLVGAGKVPAEKVPGDCTFYRDGFPVARQIVPVPNSTRDFTRLIRRSSSTLVMAQELSKLVEITLSMGTENPTEILEEMAMHLHLSGYGVIDLGDGTYRHGATSTDDQDDAVRARLMLRCS